MLRTVGIRGYRSLREVVLPLGRLTVITGANGTGKSSVYRALRLLADCGRGEVIGSLAREGGLESVLWAGPEQLQAARRRGRAEPTLRSDPFRLSWVSHQTISATWSTSVCPMMPARIRRSVRTQRSNVRRCSPDRCCSRFDIGPPHPTVRRGERRVRARLRRADPVAAHLPQRARRIRPSCSSSRTRRRSGPTARLAVLRRLPR